MDFFTQVSNLILQSTVLINKSILQIKLATQEKMICLEKSNQT